MSTRQDTLEERLGTVEEKLSAIQEQIDLLPDTLTRCFVQHNERQDQRRNFLHPDAAGSVLTSFPGFGGSGTSSPLHQSPSPQQSAYLYQQQTSQMNQIPHSRSAPNTQHPWPTSPVLPSVSSRTPHLVPDTPQSEVSNRQQMSQPGSRQASQQSDASGRS